tara:strand:+ start:57829 stop:58542 length:714 start_codon:yes stop_codon:yes gene_type:complete
MEIIGSGKYTSAFVQNGFTYKVLHEDKKNQSNFTKLELEFSLLKILESTGLPVPSKVSKIVDDEKKICGLQYQYIKGIEFKNFSFNEKSREKFLNSISDFFKKLHSINYDSIDKKPTNISKEIYKNLLIKNQEKISRQRFLQASAKIDIMSNIKIKDLSLIHGDINDGNFILKNNGEISGVIDWSEHMMSDPAYDLAGALIYFGKDTLSYILKHNNYSGEMQERINYYASMEFLFHL